MNLFREMWMVPKRLIHGAEEVFIRKAGTQEGTRGKRKESFGNWSDNQSLRASLPLLLSSLPAFLIKNLFLLSFVI